MSESARTALQILGLFSIRRPSLGVSEIAREMAIPKSNAFRLAAALTAEGFLVRAEGHRYRLGLRLHRLGGIVARNHILYGPALDALMDLRRDTGESAHLAVLEGIELIHLERIRSNFIVRLTNGVGYTSPRHATSTGKVLLAHASPSVQDEAIAAGLPRLTKNTITRPDLFRRELETIRQNGYAIAEGEFMANVKGIGVPIIDGRGQVVAGMSIVGEAATMGKTRTMNIVSLLRRASEKLTKADLQL